MKTVLIAIGVGVCVESALVGVLALGGLGPCGPSSLLGSAILLVRAPGTFAWDAFGVGERASMILVPSTYVAFWSGAAYLFLRSPRRRT
jgi:hypothetical protein